jgi:spore coat protein SA
MKTKICLIPPPFLPIPAIKGGAVESLIQFLVEENEKKHAIDLLAFSIYDSIAEIESQKYKYSHFFFIRYNIFENCFHFLIRIISKAVRIFFKDSGYIYNIYYSKCFKIIRKENPEYIIAEGGDYFKFKYLLKYFDRNRLYVHVHEHLKPSPKIVSIFGNVIGVSKFVTNEYVRYAGYSNFKSYTLLNCINEDFFRKTVSQSERDNLRIKLGFKVDDFVVLFCGRIIEVKGLRELITAIKQIENDTIKLLVIGSPNFGQKKKTAYSAQIDKLIKQMNNRILFTGYIRNSELYRYHGVADIIVVPSLWEEPFGLSLLEGMASGLPSIVTKSGGIIEVASNDSAIFIDKNDQIVDSLAKNILYLYNNEDKRHLMSTAAITKSKEYSREKYYRNFVSIFNKNENYG